MSPTIDELIQRAEGEEGPNSETWYLLERAEEMLLDGESIAVMTLVDRCAEREAAMVLMELALPEFLESIFRGNPIVLTQWIVSH